MKRIQLEYFVRVVEEKSFTKAAERLFISQPALSKSIRALEQELGVTLFRRDPREVSLTGEGEIVYRYAMDILSYWKARTEELTAALEQGKGTLRFGLPPSVGSVFFSRVLHEYGVKFPQVNIQIFEGTSKKIETMVKGTLRFGLPPSVGSVFFSRVLHEYGVKFPQVNIQIFEGTSKKIETMVTEDQIDLGVVIEPYENPHMRLKTVYRSDVVLAVSQKHRLARRATVDFAELKEEPMLLVSKEYMFHDQVLARCAQAGFVPNVTFTTSQWDLLLEMTAENHGVTLIGRPLVEKLYRDRICCVALREPEFPWTLGLICKKCKALTGAAKSFWNFCDEP